MVTEKHDGQEKSFDEALPVIEIINEGEAKTFKDLTDQLELVHKLHCKSVYVILDQRYLTFIHSFNQWRRGGRIPLVLKHTKSSSFEASLLTIKELIGEKRLIFPPDSTIKSQLTAFSKTSLKDAVDFYAVLALTMVIDAFGKQKAVESEEKPNMRGGWGDEKGNQRGILDKT